MEFFGILFPILYGIISFMQEMGAVIKMGISRLLIKLDINALQSTPLEL